MSEDMPRENCAARSRCPVLRKLSVCEFIFPGRVKMSMGAHGARRVGLTKLGSALDPAVPRRELV